MRRPLRGLFPSDQSTDALLSRGDIWFAPSSLVPMATCGLATPDDEVGYCESCITCLTQCHEGVLAVAPADVTIVLDLVCDGGLPPDVGAIRSIIVAHEKAHLTGKREDWLYRAIERTCVPTGMSA